MNNMDTFFPKKRQRPLELSHAVRLTTTESFENDRNTSESSLVALATQIQCLRDRMQSMDREHSSQISQLLRENKHLQQHIRMVQEQLQKSRQYSILYEKQQDRQHDLELYVKNLEAEIKRRQQRQLILMQQNESLSLQIQQIQSKPCKDCEQHRQTAQTLLRDNASYKAQVSVLSGALHSLKQEKESLERDLDLLMQIKKNY